MPENQTESWIDLSRINEMKPIDGPSAVQAPVAAHPAAPAAEPAKAAPRTVAAEADKPNPLDKKEDGAAAPLDTPAAEAPKTDPAPSDQDFEAIDLTPEEVDSISSDVFGMPTAEVFERLQKLEQLEKEGAFKSEKHKKLYDFVNSYPGDDFSQGVARYARLQSSDFASMDAKSVLFEKFIQENPDLSERDAQEVFEHKFKKDYAAIDDPDHEDHRVTKITLDKEKTSAIRSLNEMREKFKAEEPAADNNQAEQFAAQRQEYLDGLEESFSSFTDPSVEFSIDGVPGSEFTFKFDNMQEVKQSMESIDSIISSLGWSDGKSVDYAKMAHDIAFIKNIEAYSEEIFKHGRSVEREAMLKEMNNSGTGAPKGQEQGSRPTPKTWEEAIAIGLENSPQLNRK